MDNETKLEMQKLEGKINFLLKRIETLEDNVKRHVNTEGAHNI